MMYLSCLTLLIYPLIVCGVVGFVLCTIPKLHWHVLLVSTAIVGASAFMLGVDCFTTAGLKEVSIRTSKSYVV